MRSSIVILAFALVVVVSGCGGAGSAATTSTQAPPTDTETGAGTTATTGGPDGGTSATTGQNDGGGGGAEPKVGSATRNDDVVSVNGDEIPASVDLHASDEVTTDDGGQAIVDMTRGGTHCVESKSSALQVLPAADVIVGFSAGRSQCSTGGTQELKTFYAGDTITITTQDPVFGVTIDGDQVTVKVVSGFAKVESRTGGGELDLRPGQQVTAVGGQVPDGSGPLQLEGDEPEIFSQLRRAADYPAAPFSEQTTVYVVPDSALSTEAQTFIASFQELIARAWPVVDFQPADPELGVPDGAAYLRIADAAQVEPCVSGVPLFSDPTTGGQWAVVASDESLQQALQSFLRVAIASGDYAGAYLKAFDGQPVDYDAVACLLQ